MAQYVEQSPAAVGINRPTIEPAAPNLLTSASSDLARSLGLVGPGGLGGLGGLDCRRQRRNVGALKFSNLQPNRVEEGHQNSARYGFPFPPQSVWKDFP